MNGLEAWEQMFHDQWAREAEKRAASVPDGDDYHLYGPDDEEDEA